MSAAITGRIGTAMRRFRKEEDGSLLIFGLFAFIMMLMMAGIALDLMRFEERRTTLQNTIDRASLAAADLQQTLPPKEVVKDYFLKAGLVPPKDEDIILTEGTFGESRKVEIKVSEQMETWFMKMVGVPELSTPAASTAEESVGQVEISLILDVSGSMNSNNRLVNLKPAAKSFVDQIFDSSEPGKVSISIIPYATQVSISDDLASYFDTTGEHAYSTCLEFEDSQGDFDSPAMTLAGAIPARVYQQNGHFDPFYNQTPPRLFNCPDKATLSNRQIMPFSGNRTELKDFIDALTADGNTSIDVGMKWGAALVDPSLAPVVDGMIAAGKIPAGFGDRPYAYDEPEALKIIVLMTDGANTTEYRLRNSDEQAPSYEQGPSLLHRNTAYREDGSSSNDYSQNQYSLYDPSRSSNKYYVFAKSAWRNKPWGDVSGDYGYSGSPRSVEMTWPDVWATMTIDWFANNIIYDAYGSSYTRNLWRSDYYSNPIPNRYIRDEKDGRTLAMCDAAKDPDRRIKIYTIAFEAPYQGRNLLRACASSDANYYNVAGLDIQEAFSGIVNSINKLRLTH